MREVLDRADAHLVEELERDRQDAGGQHPRHRARGVGEIGEVGHADAGRLGRGHEPQRQLGHHRKRALAPAEQSPQVITGDVLHEAPAAANDLSRRQHRLDAEHVVARDAVLQRAQTARALRDVPADGRDGLAARVRREQEALRGRRLRQLDRAHARLADRDELRVADLLDLAHPRQHEHDAAAVRDRPGAQIRARPAWNDRDPPLVGDAEHPGDLLGRRREHDRIGTTALQRRRIRREGQQRALVGPHMVAPDHPLQLLSQPGGRRRSARHARRVPVEPSASRATSPSLRLRSRVHGSGPPRARRS